MLDIPLISVIFFYFFFLFALLLPSKYLTFFSCKYLSSFTSINKQGFHCIHIPLLYLDVRSLTIV